MEIGERFTPSLFRLAFSAERLWPWFFSYYLRRLLGKYRDRGLITDYKVKFTRKEKYHYVIELELFLTK